MVGQIVTELVIIVALLLLNGVFSMSEIAVVTARKVRLARRADGGDQRARAALALAGDPTQFLSTVQVGITLVGIFAGAFGGATIAEELAPFLAPLPGVGPYAESAALVLVVAVITFLAVVIGELVPKRIALAHAETIASWVARPMGLLARLGGPVVWLLTASTELLLRIIPVSVSGEPSVTEDDIRALVAQGTAGGVVDEEEEEILDRVLHLGDRPVTTVMTRRTEVEWIEVTADARAVSEAFASRDDARLLVCEGGIENVLGVVRAREVVVQSLRGEAIDLRALARRPLFVPETTSLLQLLTSFRQSEVQSAVVLDEFGGVEGLATLDDILEDLVADLPGRPGVDGREIVRRPDGSWLIGGSAEVELVDEELGIERPAAEQDRGYRTMAGFIMTELGRVPQVGEHLDRWGYRFEVVDVDGRRIDRLLVSRLEPPAGPTR